MDDLLGLNGTQPTAAVHSVDQPQSEAQTLNANGAQLSANSGQNQPQRSEIFRVGVKPPVFCKDQPDLYFLQIESQFTVARITVDETKYHHVVSSLEPQYLIHIAHVMRNPPPNGKYEAVKDALIAEYADSDQKKLRKLIKEIELGDSKPSTLLKRMRDLAHNQVNDDTLKTLWLERLPDTVRSVISIVDGNLTQMAKQADKMMEMHNFASVSAIQGQPDSTLLKEIQELRLAIDELKRGRNDNRGNNNGINNRSQSKSRDKSKPKFPFCRYHFKFGDKAKKCTEPCQFKKLSPSEN